MNWKKKLKSIFSDGIENLNEGVKMWLDYNDKLHEFELYHKISDKNF